MSEPVPGGDLRSRIDQQLEQTVDDEVLRELLSATLASTKRVWGDFKCKSCGKQQKQQVDIADSKMAIQALEILLNQTKGRPGVAEGVEDDRIVFERVVYLGDEEPEGVPV